MLIDFKSDGDPDHEAAILGSALAAVARPELIDVSSFSIPFLERFQELAPEFPLYPIISLRQNVFTGFATMGEVDRQEARVKSSASAAT